MRNTASTNSRRISRRRRCSAPGITRCPYLPVKNDGDPSIPQSIGSTDLAVNFTPGHIRKHLMERRGKRRDLRNRGIFPRLFRGAGPGDDHRDGIVIEDPTQRQLNHGHPLQQDLFDLVGQCDACFEGQACEGFARVNRAVCPTRSRFCFSSGLFSRYSLSRIYRTTGISSGSCRRMPPTMRTAISV